LLLCLLTAPATCAHASVALLMEEPYGKFSAMNPTGYAAIYFNYICADSPTVLRSYHKIDGYDWIAMPLLAIFTQSIRRATFPSRWIERRLKLCGTPTAGSICSISHRTTGRAISKPQ